MDIPGKQINVSQPAADTQPNTTAKLLAGGGAGALTVIVVWALKQWAHTEVPTEVAMALSTIISIGAAHFTPLGPSK